jgi:GT2 family glycosyltransferase
MQTVAARARAHARVGIVILNWNRLDLTKKCLASVAAQSYANPLVYVIDNGSTDGSVKWLSKQPAITLIQNSKNLGFARALNQGIRAALEADCKYVISLNNDAEIASDWLEKLVGYMQSHPSIGFAQGASMQAENRSIYDSSGIYLESGYTPRQRALGASDPQLNLPAIGPNAAGSIYRASMLHAVAYKKQFFDERFFAYVEDVDFNLRCTMRGYKFAFVPAAKLFHVGSATGQKVAKKKMFWGARNSIWLVYKNAPAYGLRKQCKAIARSHLANLQYLWREQRHTFWPYFWGVTIGIISCPLFWSARRHNLKATIITREQYFNLFVPARPPLVNPFRKIRNLLQ